MHIHNHKDNLGPEGLEGAAGSLSKGEAIKRSSGGAGRSVVETPKEVQKSIVQSILLGDALDDDSTVDYELIDVCCYFLKIAR